MRNAGLKMVHELARRDSRVIFVGGDGSAGALGDMQREMPDRVHLEGISEANLIGMAAGLAMEGYIPYVSAIAPFVSRRVYEQIAVDLCLHNLPVRILAAGSGLSYSTLGPTHQAIEDLAILRVLPNMTVVAPTDGDEMRRLMERTLEPQGPIYIRFGPGGEPIVSRDQDGFQIGKAIVLRDPGEAVIISTGILAGRALTAAASLEKDGISCGVVNMHTLKPVDQDCILHLGRTCRLIATVEEHLRMGGLGSAVADVLVDHLDGPIPRMVRMGLPDAFVDDYGSQDHLFERYGLQAPQIANTTRAAFSTLPAI